MERDSTEVTHRTIPLWAALIPMLILIVLLIFSVYLFGSDSSWGPNQIALILSALLASLIGKAYGYRSDEMGQGVVRSISQALPALFILLAVGSLIGTWAMSGTLGTMIYYGIQLLDTNYFYPSVLIVTALISASIGSSWTTAGTVGIGVIGISHGLGLSDAITAGAVISGSYFGDKLSPLSDTTNLAATVSGVDLYTHIRHMLWSTLPSILIALAIYAYLGVNTSVAGAPEIQEQTMRALEQYYHLSPWLLVPLAAVIIMSLLRWRPFPVIMTGAVLGGIFAVIFQSDMVAHYLNRPELPAPLVQLAGVWKAMYSGYEVATGFPLIDKLLNRGGMGSMLEVIWLILSALMFGGVMESIGALQRILDALLHAVKGTGSLIAATLATAFGLNLVASDQYMAITLTGRMYRLEFQRRKLAPENLSRSLEDSGTITSALIPWNTCGAYMAGTLGVATLAYAPYSFFNWINPLVALLLGFTGWSVKKAGA